MSTDAQRPRTSTRDHEDLRRRLVAWLGLRVDEPEVSALAAPESNGMSSETLLFDATWGTGDERAAHRCAARLSPDPLAAPVFPVYDLGRQFRVMALVAARSAVPVPATMWWEPDAGALGAPFFVMEQVDGLVPPDVMPYPFGSWLSEADQQDQQKLQDSALATLAELHGARIGPHDTAFLELDCPGDSALRRHVAHSAAYYEWVVSDGARSPLIERGLAWIDAHWPAHEGPSTISWGDARIGNMMFRHFKPVAVLDWEMAATGPREVDLGWMIYLHRFLDDIALQAGLPGMPGFMRLDDAVATYEAAAGVEVRNIGFYTFYAALRHAIVMSRVARRQVLFGEMSMPEDPDDMIMHRSTLEEMLAGTYWSRF
ncbi:MAG TPA: phosphotransferase family protein [Acidimicrobiales bacterium]|nr:phosphotransferase family protein [Acidimicrobiales bacterium]